MKTVVITGSARGLGFEMAKLFKKNNLNVVISDLKHTLPDKYGFKHVDIYKNENIVYFNIEDIYYKRKIIISNRKMIDNSSIVVCYVDFRKSQSGAKSAVMYAIKNNVPIINLFQLV